MAFISAQPRSTKDMICNFLESSSISRKDMILPKIPLTGVRNSCVIFATNSDLTLAAALASSPTWSTLRVR